MYDKDERVVITLDAGGTNLVFGAMRGCEYVGDPLTLPSNSHDLDLCLQAMVTGFEAVIARLGEKPAAISFAFPGPADYAAGIVGGYLPYFPSFREGVALGPCLEEKFGVPVFINNDGDLFAFGEAMAGALPDVNRRVAEAGGEKAFSNLLGYTFGTGLGIGMVIGGRLNEGNNSCIETYCLPALRVEGAMAEDYASIRAITREYGYLSGNPDHGLTPKEICEIADGKRDGDRDAAVEAFRLFGEQAGDVMATAVSLTDSLIVLGGGLTGAAHHIVPALIERMRSSVKAVNGEDVRRVQPEVFDLDNPEEFDRFVKGAARKLKVYGSTDRYVTYDPMKRTGVILSKLGASKAISIGAYAFALAKLDARD